MFKNLIAFYAMTVCFLAVIVLMIANVHLLKNALDLCIPEHRNAFYHDFTSNENFVARKKKDANTAENKEISQWTDQEITTKRLLEKKINQEEYRSFRISVILDDVIWIVMAALFFGVHWRLYKKEEKR